MGQKAQRKGEGKGKREKRGGQEKGEKGKSSNIIEPKLLEFNYVTGISTIHLPPCPRVIKSVQPIKGDGLELDLPSYPQHN